MYCVKGVEVRRVEEVCVGVDDIGDVNVGEKKMFRVGKFYGGRGVRSYEVV